MNRLRYLLALALLPVSALAQPIRAQGPAAMPLPGDGASVVTQMPGLSPVGLTGQLPGDEFGTSVADAGDVNGDGYDDVIVGAPANNSHPPLTGAAYIYFGGPAMTNTPDVTLRPNDDTAAFFGISVAGAGDVNGDGFDDVIVGAFLEGVTDAGAAYVYFGGLAMDDEEGVLMTGLATFDFFGFSAAGAGDVNGDSYDDVAVGAPQNDGGGMNAGAVYVFFGGPAMDGEADVVVTGQAADDFFGYSVSLSGDVNGDSYDDLIVGAILEGATNAGAAYVFSGGPSFTGTLSATDAEVSMVGPDGGNFGFSVASAGDLSGDGLGDVVVGAPSNDAGAAYVFFGGMNMDPTPDVTMTGQEVDDEFGRSVAGVRDANGDGHLDIIVGAEGNDGVAPGAGRAYVFLGGPDVDAAPDLVVSGLATGERFGGAVGGGGDVDADGRADFLVGAPGYDNDRGRAQVLSVRLTGEDFPDEFFTGEAVSDRFGTSVASAGDVNGDGFDDLAIGAPNVDGGGVPGHFYAFFGGPSMDSDPEVVVVGFSGSDLYGYAVSSAGDVNADGYDDVIVGAPQDDVLGFPNIGAAYVYSLSGAPLAVKLFGGLSSDKLVGYAVSSAGDVNGDGYDDVIVGAPGFGQDPGAAYVYFGGPTLDPNPDVKLFGESLSDGLGSSVAGAGDVNADGYADVVVGTRMAAEKTYVFFGGQAMDDVADVTMPGPVSQVAIAGDVNGDGYDDVIVGAELGAANVFFGGQAMDDVADVTMTSPKSGDGFGTSVSGAGDVNGDGYDDVIVGAYRGGVTDAGVAYVFFGGALMDAEFDVTMTGEADGDRFGISVSSAGDVDGDGAADVIVGAYLNNAGGVQAGRAYLYRSTYPSVVPRITAVEDVPDDEGGFVTVAWTRSAYDDDGVNRVTQYLVQRSRPPVGGVFAWEPVATIPATHELRYSAVVPTYGMVQGGASEPVFVRITAQTAHPDEFWRSLVASGVSVDDSGSPSGIEGDDDPLPLTFALHPPFPNPAAARALVRYDLPEAAPVTLAVYDVLGRRVALLVSAAEQPAGRHTVAFDAISLASGLYVCRLEAGAFVQTHRMTVVR